MCNTLKNHSQRHCISPGIFYHDTVTAFYMVVHYTSKSFVPSHWEHQQLFGWRWMRGQWSWVPQEYRIYHWWPWPVAPNNSSYMRHYCNKVTLEDPRFSRLQNWTNLTIWSLLGSYFSWLTPTTNIGASADGAEMMTRLAPPFKWTWHLSIVVKTPVDSTTYSAPAAPQPMFSGFILSRNHDLSQ